jgi:hypothetical protein
MVLVCTSCDDSGNNPTRATRPNLIHNSSFEYRGAPTMIGWATLRDSVAKVISGEAPEGGRYVLEIGTRVPNFSRFAWTLIPDIRDGDIVTASTLAKGVGSIQIFVGGPPGSESGRGPWKQSTSLDWNTIQVIDTMQLVPDDSVWVVLYGPSCEFCYGEFAQFDLVHVTRRRY